MSYARVYARAVVGVEAPLVTVEAHSAPGNGFAIVGLPEPAVKEARDRVASAISRLGFVIRDGRLVINLAPADLNKAGGRFDLAIAVSILAATGQLPAEHLGHYEFLGELGLDGDVRPVNGTLCAAIAIAREPGNGRRLVVAHANAAECALADIPIDAVHHLGDAVALLASPPRSNIAPRPDLPAAPAPRLDPIIGQAAAKRALMVAAAGGHHLLMIGPPGTGKTLLARRLSELLPDLPPADSTAVAAVYSARGLRCVHPNRPPFRDPHHTASGAALVGGGSDPMPGEISLAHCGVLFLDELPEYGRSVLDALREPLESREIVVARARLSARFPARFQLIAAMNPCPAGRICTQTTCRCSAEQVRRYQARLSGPLLDRIDLHVPVPQLDRDLLGRLEEDEPIDVDALRARLTHAHTLQRARQGVLNAELTPRQLADLDELEPAAKTILNAAARTHRLSMRSYHRLLKVARSIADLEEGARVGPHHMAEAVSYRALDWDRGVS